MVVGENGVLNRAKNAATDTATAQAQEALSMAVSGLQGVFANDIANGTNQEFISYIWYGGEKPESSGEPVYDGTKGKQALQGQLSDYTISDFSGTEAGPITVKMNSKTSSTPSWTFYIKKSGSIGATVSDKNN